MGGFRIKSRGPAIYYGGDGIALKSMAHPYKERSLAASVAMYFATGLSSFVIAAFVVAYVTVFKHAPTNLFGVFCWLSLAHVLASPLRPPAVYGSWLFCVVGLLLAAGTFT